MLMSRYQKAGKERSEKIANRFFEDVAKFKYLGTAGNIPDDGGSTHL
jgi:hypothetical protein